MSSPTQRSLAHWRGIGSIAAVVERFNSFIKIRQDVFGFADIICVNPLYSGTVYVQTTSGENIQARIKKIHDTPEIAANVKRVLGAGNTVIVEGWAKRTKAKRTLRYERVAYRCEMDGDKLKFVGGA